MGKGKRNKLLRTDDNAVAPQQQNKAKKQFVMPVWAKRALCIVLLVAVLAGIIAAAIVNSGAILRGRILVESKTGKFDMNQQMATFILWQYMYEQSYYEYYYGGYYNQSISMSEFCLYWTQSTVKGFLKSNLSMIKDSLIQLVAGADAAYEAGLRLDAQDKQAIKDVVTNVKNLYANFGFATSGIPFKNFLTEYVGDNLKTSDIEDAARLMVMYTKYQDYMSFDKQDDPDKTTLQNFITKNPAGFFETKYYSYTGADQAMIRELFGDEFIEEYYESTVAKYFANADKLAVEDLKDAKKAAKLEELGLTNAIKYTRTEGEDGEYTYSPELAEPLRDYIFGSSNKSGNFATIVGDNSNAYLVYYKENSTATEATVAIKEYKYENYKDDLADIVNLNALITECIKAGENTTDYKTTDNEKAAEKLDILKKDETKNISDITEGAVDVKTEILTTKPIANDDPNEAPQAILDVLYAKDANVSLGWSFVANGKNASYVVKVVSIKKDPATGNDTDSYVISYATFKNDTFVDVLETFEEEFNLYLLNSKFEAPTYSDKFKNFDEFEQAIVNWLVEENFKETVLQKYANDDLDELLAEKAKGEAEFEAKLNTLFGENSIQTFEKSDAEKKRFETEFDSSVYTYIFKSENKDKASVIVGKDDNVFLVYVKNIETKDNHTHSQAAIKKYNLDDYSKDLTYEYEKDGNTESKPFKDQIIADLLADGRKDTTTYKSADDLAKEELDALNKTDAPKTWAEFTTVSITKPVEKNDPNTAPKAIITDIYPAGHKATEITKDLNKFYQVNDNGTSYVYKILSKDNKLGCEVQYKSFEDEDYYSYFRVIQSKLNASFKEDAATVTYPNSITEGSVEDWLFESEYTEAENKREFDRVKNDLTFIANVDTKNNVTSLTIYLVDEPAAQKNDEEITVHAGYQLFETEKEAQKALKKLNGLTNFDLYHMFSSFDHREEVDGHDENYASGYVKITSPTISEDMKKADVTDDNLEAWLFDANRKANDAAIVAAKDGKGYYLTIFFSTEQAWLRTARTGWVNEYFQNHMKDLVADYELNEKAMEKIEDVETTTTAATK